MSRPGRTLTISLAPGDKEVLEELAAEHGCFWGENPSITELVKAIVDGRLVVGKPAKSGAARMIVRKTKKVLKDALDELERI
jgi:hypothetical protein